MSDTAVDILDLEYEKWKKRKTPSETAAVPATAPARATPAESGADAFDKAYTDWERSKKPGAEPAAAHHTVPAAPATEFTPEVRATALSALEQVSGEDRVVDPNVGRRGESLVDSPAPLGITLEQHIDALIAGEEQFRKTGERPTREEAFAPSLAREEMLERQALRRGEGFVKEANKIDIVEYWDRFVTDEHIPAVGIGTRASRNAILLNDISVIRQSKEDYIQSELADERRFRGQAQEAARIAGLNIPAERADLDDDQIDLLTRKADVQYATARANISRYLEARDEIEERGLTVGAQILGGVSELPNFMLEFFLAGGAARLTSQAAKHAARRVLGRYAKRTLLRKTFIKGIGWVGGAVARTALTGGARVMQGTTQRELATWYVDESGKIAVPVDSQLWTSVLNSFTDVLLENMSETAGAGLGKGAKRLGGAATKALASKAPRLAEALRRAAKVLGPLANKRGVFNRAGFHGLFEEMGEERLKSLMGAVLTAITPLEQGKFGDIIPTGEQFLVELGVLLIPTGARAALGGVKATGERLQPTQAQPAAEAEIEPTAAPAEPTQAAVEAAEPPAQAAGAETREPPGEPLSPDEAVKMLGERGEEAKKEPAPEREPTPEPVAEAPEAIPARREGWRRAEAEEELTVARKPVKVADVESVFGGAEVYADPDTEGSYQVDLPSGEFFTLKVSEELAPDVAYAEKIAGRKLTESERATLENLGTFELSTEDGQAINGLGILHLSRNAAKSTTLRHMAVHVARLGGFWTGEQWQSLVEKHSSADRTALQQEEDVVEALSGKEGFWQRVQAYFRKVAKGLGLSGEGIEDLIDNPEFWSRKAEEQPAVKEQKVEIKVNFPPSEKFAVSLAKVAESETFGALANHLGVTQVRVDPPHTFEPSQRGGVSPHGVIRLNPGEGSMDYTFPHELGELAYRAMTDAQKNEAAAIVQRNLKLIKEDAPGYVDLPNEAFAHLVGREVNEAIELAMKVDTARLKFAAEPTEPTRKAKRTKVESWDEILAGKVGGYLAAEHDLATMIKKHGDRMVVMKDTNGGRHSIPASVLLAFEQNPVIEGYIREVWVVPGKESLKVQLDDYTLGYLGQLNAEMKGILPQIGWNYERTAAGPHDTKKLVYKSGAKALPEAAEGAGAPTTEGETPSTTGKPAPAAPKPAEMTLPEALAAASRGETLPADVAAKYQITQPAEAAETEAGEAEKPKDAKAELSDALDEFGKHMRGKLGLNMLLDPVAWRLSAKITAKAIQLGATKVSEVFRQVADAVGEKYARAIRPHIRAAWKKLHAGPLLGAEMDTDIVPELLSAAAEDMRAKMVRQRDKAKAILRGKGKNKQALVESVIDRAKAVLRGLPGAKSKLVTQGLVRAWTPARVDKLFARIDQLLQGEKHRQAVAKFKALEKKVRRWDKDYKLPAGLRELLLDDDVKGTTGLLSGLTATTISQKTRSQLEGTIEQAGLNPDMLDPQSESYSPGFANAYEAAEAALKKESVRSMTTEEIEDINRVVTALLHQVKLKNKLLGHRKNVADTVKEQVDEFGLAPRKAKYESGERGGKDKPGFVSELAGARHRTFFRLFNLVSELPGKLTPLRRVCVDSVWNALRAVKNKRLTMWKFVREQFRSAGVTLTPKALTQASDYLSMQAGRRLFGLKKRVAETRSVKTPGVIDAGTLKPVAEMNLSAGEVAIVLATAANPKVAAHMAKFGAGFGRTKHHPVYLWSNEAIAAIRAGATKMELAAADTLLALGRENRGYINEKFRETDGVDLITWDEAYVRIHADFQSLAKELRTGFLTGRSIHEYGRWQRRKKHHLPLVMADAFYEIAQTISEVSRLEQMGPHAAARKLMAQPEIDKELRTRLGTDFPAVYGKYLAEAEGVGAQPSKPARVYHWAMRRFAYPAYIVSSVSVLPIQLASYVNLANASGLSRVTILKNVARMGAGVFSHTPLVKRLVQVDGYFAERYARGHGVSVVTPTAARGIDAGWLEYRGPRVNSPSFWDKAVIEAVAGVAKANVTKNLGRELRLADDADAQLLAAETLRLMSEGGQPMFDALHKSPLQLQARTSALAGGLTVFSSARMAISQGLHDASDLVVYAAHSKTATKKQRAAAAGKAVQNVVLIAAQLAVVEAIRGVAFGLIWPRRKKEEERRLRHLTPWQRAAEDVADYVADFIGLISFLGPLAHAVKEQAVQRVTKRRAWQREVTPLINIASSVGDTMLFAADAIAGKEFDNKQLEWRIGQAVTALGAVTGTSARNAYRAILAARTALFGSELSEKDEREYNAKSMWTLLGFKDETFKPETKHLRKMRYVEQTGFDIEEIASLLSEHAQRLGAKPVGPLKEPGLAALKRLGNLERFGFSKSDVRRARRIFKRSWRPIRRHVAD